MLIFIRFAVLEFMQLNIKFSKSYLKFKSLFRLQIQPWIIREIKELNLLYRIIQITGNGKIVLVFMKIHNMSCF